MKINLIQGSWYKKYFDKCIFYEILHFRGLVVRKKLPYRVWLCKLVTSETSFSETNDLNILFQLVETNQIVYRNSQKLILRDGISKFT